MAPSRSADGKIKERTKKINSCLSANSNMDTKRHRSHSSTMSRRPVSSSPILYLSSQDGGRSDLRKTRHQKAFSVHSYESAFGNIPSDKLLPEEGHRAVLASSSAARRSRSPSSISIFTTSTSLTTATNTSSGSSGSNSTVTQASVSGGFLGPDSSQGTDLPTAPDAPNVFEFLEEKSDSEEETADDEDEGGNNEDVYLSSDDETTSATPSVQEVLPESRLQIDQKGGDPEDKGTVALHETQIERLSCDELWPPGHFFDHDPTPQTSVLVLPVVPPVEAAQSDALSLSHSTSMIEAGRSSSSGSSSFQDSSYDTTNHSDTSRSTSPELYFNRSIYSATAETVPPSPVLNQSLPTVEPSMQHAPELGLAETKTTAQETAARHRQSLHNLLQHHRQASFPQPIQGVMSSPPWFQPPSTTAEAPRQPPGPPTEHRRAGREAKASRKKRVVKPSTAGYAQLARALTARVGTSSSASTTVSPQPLYRRFSTLSHRYLLDLQDQLAELETSLKEIDNYRSMMFHPTAINPQSGQRLIIPVPNGPDSRRSRTGTEYRRAQLMYEIGIRLKLYQEALMGTENLDHGFVSAQAHEIEAYQTWMSRERPIVDDEVDFLNHREDLISLRKTTRLSRPLNPPVTVSSMAGFYSGDAIVRILFPPDTILSRLMIAFAMMVLFPILMFTIVPSFSGRMIIASLVACGVMGGQLYASELGLHISRRERAVFGVGYMFSMALFAMVVR